MAAPREMKPFGHLPAGLGPLQHSGFLPFDQNALLQLSRIVAPRAAPLPNSQQ